MLPDFGRLWHDCQSMSKSIKVCPGMPKSGILLWFQYFQPTTIHFHPTLSFHNKEQEIWNIRCPLHVLMSDSPHRCLIVITDSSLLPENNRLIIRYKNWNKNSPHVNNGWFGSICCKLYHGHWQFICGMLLQYIPLSSQECLQHLSFFLKFQGMMIQPITVQTDSDSASST